MDESNQDSLANPAEPVCITCGYDLRSLPTEESCPECGTPIELSLRGELLSHSDPAWVARIARGQSLLVSGIRVCLICMACAFVTPFFGLGLRGLFASRFGINIPSWVFIDLFWSLGGVFIIGALVTTLGCTLINTPDPRDSLRESSTSSRAVARKALFAMYACVPASLVAGLLPLVGTNARILAAIFLLTVGTCFTIALIATLRWLTALAKRIPDHDLCSSTLKSALFFRWALPVFILLFVIPMGLAKPAAAGGALIGPGALSSMAICLGLIVAVGLLIGLVWLYVDLVAYRNAFRRCATEADTAKNERSVTS